MQTGREVKWNISEEKVEEFLGSRNFPEDSISPDSAITCVSPGVVIAGTVTPGLTSTLWGSVQGHLSEEVEQTAFGFFSELVNFGADDWLG